MKSVSWLLALTFGTMVLSSQALCHPEISYGKKCDERKTKKENESKMLFKNQTEVSPNDPTWKPEKNILGTCIEAMAAAGQAFGQAMDNLFTIRISEESGWKKKQYVESTNSPISTLTPVLNNLQQVGSP